MQFLPHRFYAEVHQCRRQLGVAIQPEQPDRERCLVAMVSLLTPLPPLILLMTVTVHMLRLSMSSTPETLR